MSDGGWYGYPPQEPDPYAQPQDDPLRTAPEYGNAPQASGYDAYGNPNHQHQQYDAYYEQQSAQEQQYRQQAQAQNPYFQQQQQQQQDYGYPTHQQHQPPQAQAQPQQYSTGQQPSVGYEGYAQQGYDTGGYPSQGYASPGYDTATGYPAQGYDSAASYDTAAYGSGAYDTGAQSGAHGGGYAEAAPGAGQQRQQAPANPYVAETYAAERTERDPYADLGERAEQPDEYEYPGRSSGRRRRADPEGRAPGVTEEGRFGLLESEEQAESPAAPGRDEEDEGEGGGRKRGRSGSKQRDKKNAKRSCLVIFLFFALIAGGLGYGGYQAYNYYQAHYGPPADFTSSTGTSATAIVTIPSGSGGDEIGSILYKAGVTASQRAFINACNANAQCADIQADTYQLHKQMSASAAVTALLNTSNVYNKAQLFVRPGERASAVFTDLEQKTGWTQAQIVSAINGGQIDLPSFAAAKPGTNYPFANIEGMLFTGTYQLPTFKTPTALLKSMVDQQVAMFNAIGLTQKASSVNMTPYQVLTVASMARAEAGSNPADLNKISGVIYTRLKSSALDKLGFDTATLYGLGRTEPQPTAQELADSGNPYNLRVKAGLPPGPIDSVDQVALMAALAPNDSTDVFFCAVNGTVHYASSDSAWAALGKQFPGYCG
jgi:UPF0755 protein